MGGRKLRFHAQKNYERKKYPKTFKISIPLDLVSLRTSDNHSTDESVPLTISIPLSMYKEAATLSDIRSLFLRLLFLNSLPQGWTLLSTPGSVVINKLHSIPPFLVTIAENFKWSLSVDRYEINIQIQDLKCIPEQLKKL